MRITLLANCQARPVADFLRLMAPSIQLVGVLITHLAKLSDEDEFNKWIENSDFVFCQFVQDNFPIEYLRTTTLRSRFGDKVVVWPNVFFRGQTPDLCYVTAPGSKRVLGPLLEYHSRPIIEGWSAGRSVDSIVRDLRDPDFDLNMPHDIIEKSFAELKVRENFCDVSISNEIAEQWQRRRLFFTFNHPSSFLLIKMGDQLLQHISCTVSIDLLPEHVGEPLSKIIPATHTSIAKKFQFQFPTSTSSRGAKIFLTDELKTLNETNFYSIDELVELSFLAYDLQNFDFASCRIT